MQYAALLLLSLTACNSLSAPELPQQQALPARRTLCLERPEYIEVLEDAVSEWEAAVGRELLTVTTERVPGCTLVRYMHEMSVKERVGEVVGAAGAWELHMRYDAPYSVLLHELGHVLGLEHVPFEWDGGRESIMNEALGGGSVITDADVEMVR